MTGFLDGFKIGHYTDANNRTGCTVVLPPEGNVASCDVRGSSPSSRELILLDTARRLTEVHAVLLTGGSAFGLAAADGVVAWLAEGMTVAAIAVVNAVGDVIGADGRSLAGSSFDDGRIRAPRRPATDDAAPTNTVLTLLATHAHLDKREVNWLAGRGSDGVTNSVRPAHTRYDGDVCFAIAAPPPPGAAETNLDVLGVLATQAVANAVRDSVRPSR